MRANQTRATEPTASPRRIARKIEMNQGASIADDTCRWVVNRRHAVPTRCPLGGADTRRYVPWADGAPLNPFFTPHIRSQKMIGISVIMSGVAIRSMNGSKRGNTRVAVLLAR